MNGLRKYWKWLLAAAAFLLAAQVTVSLVVRTKRVHRYLTAHLERAFGRPVEVEHFGVQFLPSPRLDADGITVGEDPAFGYEYFLRAEHLSAGLRWTGLLRGHFDFGTLTIARPSLNLVRNAEGRWNLERWLPPAKSAAGDTSRVYGPPLPPAPANRLKKIEFDEGRIDFKEGNDKQAFAFTNVSGSVEQVSSGRWQVRLDAQPWRSGAALQSTGTLRVRGDVAGTSARLQPAQFSVHWGDASVADLFRLLTGVDSGVRGLFTLDATAKSAAPSDARPGEWTFSVHANASQIHRWDMTEHPDNPRLSVRASGHWNVAGGNVNAEELVVEAPHSNLRGSARLPIGANSGFELRLDSAGIQAADLLAWYRSFQPDVSDDVVATQFFTGAAALHGWPLQVDELAFSSRGGEIAIPGTATLRVGEVRGGTQRRRLVVEPFAVSLVKTGARAPARESAGTAKKRAGVENANVLTLAMVHDLDAHAGNVSVQGRTSQVEDFLKISSAFGRTLNHGWDLSGEATADLRWEWQNAQRPRWNGKIQVAGSELQAAGLNQPVQMDDASMSWTNGVRSADLAKVHAFGASWSGQVVEFAPAIADEQPKWQFRLHADHLDATELDRWMGPRARPGWLQRLLPSLLGGGSSAPSAPASELVRRVNAEGELKIDELTVEKLKFEQVRAHGELTGLQLNLTDANAQWAGGEVRAQMQAEFAPKPRYDIRAELGRINLAVLPLSGRSAQRFAGTAAGTLHLAAEGVGRDALLQSLSGTGTVSLKNAEFHGWDIGASLRDGEPKTGNSRWNSGAGTFSVENGTIHVEKLNLDADSDHAEVRGNIRFTRDADLQVQTSTNRKKAAAADGAKVLKITGSLDGPQLSIGAPVL